MKKLLMRIWFSLAGIIVMLVTVALLGVLHVFVFFRKIFYGKDFVPNALKNLNGQEEMIGSANAQLNTIQANLEKAGK